MSDGAPRPNLSEVRARIDAIDTAIQQFCSTDKPDDEWDLNALEEALEEQFNCEFELEHGNREGILRGLAITGGVITSAGLVLAATFAALAVIPILFLAQIAFIVAFGVLLDTFVVRSLLVPALTYDIGRAIWWPSRLARAPRDESAP